MRALELHAHAKQVQRSAGKSSVAAAAYRAGEKLYEERTGITHDYTRKQGVEFKRIYLPENAPENLRDREMLWNASEKKENRSNSCTAHELEVGFPYEFNAMQRREAGDKIARELMHRYGCAVDICFHAPNKNNDERNFHAHILFTTRGFDSSTKDGWAKTKFRNLSNDPITVNGDKTTKGKKEVLSLRQFTANAMNAIAKRDGLSVKVEHLSFEKRGIDKQAQVHLGPVANDMEKKDMATERGDQNIGIEQENEKTPDIRKQVEGIQYEVFDEFAGAKRAALQQWKWDMTIDESRRCEGENRRLEAEHLKLHGERESKYKAQVQMIKDNLGKGGVTAALRSVTGAKQSDLVDLAVFQKNLKSIEIRKKEEKDALFRKQLERRKEHENLYRNAKKKVEEEIFKARSLYRESESEGKGEQGDSVIPKTTFSKIKNKVSQRNNEVKKSEKAKEDRKPSYAGSDIKYKQRKRLKDKHSHVAKSEERTATKRKAKTPEFDYSPPRGPSRGR